MPEFLTTQELKAAADAARAGEGTVNPNTGLSSSTDTPVGLSSEEMSSAAVGARASAPAYLGEGDFGLNPSEYDFTIKYSGDNDDIRARRESSAKTVAKGATRLVGSTLTKLLAGVGYSVSALPALIEGDMSTMLDNGWSQAFNSMEESMKEALPVYKTNKYLNGGVWEQMGTLGFWMDDVVDGAAFMASALIGAKGMGALGKSMGLYGRTARATSRILNAIKGGKEVVNATATASKIANSLGMAGMTAFNTVNEAAFEAKDLKDSMLQQLQTEVTLGRMTQEEANIAASKAAKADFWLNAALLLPSNYLSLDLVFGGVGSKKLTKSMMSGIMSGKTGGEAAKAATKTLSFIDKAKIAGTEGLLSSLSEGVYEENFQLAAQNYSRDRALGNTDKSILAGMLDNAVENFGTIEGRKSMALGAIIGIIPGAAGGVRGAKQAAKTQNNIMAATGKYYDMLKKGSNSLYKKNTVTDAEGKVTEGELILDKKGNPILDEQKVAAMFEKAYRGADNFVQAVKADIAGNETMVDFIKHMEYTSMAFDMFNTGGGANDVANLAEAFAAEEKRQVENAEYENEEDRHAALDRINNSTRYYTNLADQLKDVYDSVHENHGGIADFGNSNSAQLFKGSLITRQFEEATKQLFYDFKIKELEAKTANKPVKPEDSIIPGLKGMQKQYQTDSKEYADAVKTLHEVKQLQKDSYDTMKSLLDTKAQKEQYEIFRDAMEEASTGAGVVDAEFSDVETESEVEEQTTQEQETVVRRFTEADAKAKGYEVDQDRSDALNAINKSTGPSYYYKADKDTGKVSIITTDNSNGNKVTLERTLYTKEAKDGSDSEYRVLTEYRNGELYRASVRDMETGHLIKVDVDKVAKELGAVTVEETSKDSIDKAVSKLSGLTYLGNPGTVTLSNAPVDLGSNKVEVKTVNEYIHSVKTAVENGIQSVVDKVNARKEELKRKSEEGTLTEADTLRYYFNDYRYDSKTFNDIFGENPGVMLRAQYGGRLGFLYRRGNNVFFASPNTKAEPLGTVNSKDSLRSKNINVLRNVSHEMSYDTDGREYPIEISGRRYKNPYPTNPTQAIGTDSVTLLNDSNETITFTDPKVVEEIAYTIELHEGLKDKVFYDATLVGDTDFLVTADTATGKEYSVYRKDGQYIVQTLNGRKVKPESKIYKRVISNIDSTINKTLESVLEKQRTAANPENLDKQLQDEFERFATVVRRGTTEEALYNPEEREVEPDTKHKEEPSDGQGNSKSEESEVKDEADQRAAEQQEAEDRKKREVEELERRKESNPEDSDVEVEVVNEEELPEGLREELDGFMGVRTTDDTVAHVFFDREAGRYVTVDKEFEKEIINSNSIGKTVEFTIDLNEDGSNEHIQKFWSKNPRLKAAIESGIITPELAEKTLEVKNPELFTRSGDAVEGIKSNLVDTIPVKITVNGKHVYFHETGYPYITMPEEIEAIRDTAEREKAKMAYRRKVMLRTRATRMRLLSELLAGSAVTSTITEVTVGYPNNSPDGTRRPVKEVLDEAGIDSYDGIVGIGTSDGIIRTDSKGGKGLGRAPRGAVMIYSDNTYNGELYGFMVNSKKISEGDAKIVLEALKMIGKKTLRDKFEMPGVEGNFLIKDVLNMLTMAGHSTKVEENDKNRDHLRSKQLYFEDNLIHYGDGNSMPMGNPTTEQEENFIAWITANKNYPVHINYLSSTLPFGSFKLGSLSYTEGQSYNDFIVNSNILESDLMTVEGTNSLTKEGIINYSTDFKVTPKKVEVQEPTKTDEPTTTTDSSSVIDESQKKAAGAVPKTTIGTISNISKLRVGSRVVYSSGLQGENYDCCTIVEKNGKKYANININLSGDLSTIGNELTKVLMSAGTTTVEVGSSHYNKFVDAIRHIQPYVYYTSPEIKVEEVEEEVKDQTEVSELLDNPFTSNEEDLKSNPDLILMNSQEEADLAFDNWKSNKNSAEILGDSFTDENLNKLAKLGKYTKPDSYDPKKIHPLYEEAKRIVITEKSASASLLSRKLSIGYNAAYKIMEGLEYEGIVSPMDDRGVRTFIYKTEDTTPPPSDGFENTGEINIDNNPFSPFKTIKAGEELGSDELDQKKVKKWLSKRFNLKGVDIEFHDKFVQALGDRNVIGQARVDAFHLSKNAPNKTVYHEAFHRVSLFLFNEKTRQKVYTTARKELNMPDATNQEIEEALADQFMEYAEMREANVPTTRVGKIKDFFNRIWNYIKSVFLGPNRLGAVELDKLYEQLYDGRFKYNRVPTEVMDSLRGTYANMEIQGVKYDTIQSDAALRDLTQNLFYIMAEEAGVVNYKATDPNLSLSSIDDVKKLNPTHLINGIKKNFNHYKSVLVNSEAALFKLNNDEYSKEELSKLKASLGNKNIDNAALKVRLESQIGRSRGIVEMFSEIYLGDRNTDIISTSTPAKSFDIIFEHMVDFMDTLNIRVTKEDSDGENDFNYDQMSFESSAKHNTAANIKVLMSILPSSTELSKHTGLFKFEEFGPVWSKLLRDSLQVHDVPSMMKVLENKSADSIQYKILLKHLENDENLRTQFFKTVSKSRMDFVNALMEKTGNILNVKMGSAELQSGKDMKIKEWSNVLQRSTFLFSTDRDGNTTVKSANFEALFDEYAALNKRMVKYDIAGTVPNIEAEKLKARNLLATVGIILDENAFHSVLADIDPQEDLAFKTFVEDRLKYILGENGSIRQAYNDGAQSPYAYIKALNNERTVDYLAERSVMADPSVTGDSILGPSGSLFYLITQHTPISNELNRLRYKTKETVEEKLKATYNQNSIFLKYIQDMVNKGEDTTDILSLKTLSNIVRTESGDRGRGYAEVTDLEELILRITANHNGYITPPTPADRKFFQYFKGIPIEIGGETVDGMLNSEGQFSDAAIKLLRGYFNDELSRIQLTERQVDAAIDGTFPIRDLVENLHFQAPKPTLYRKGSTVKAGDVLVDNGVVKFGGDTLTSNNLKFLKSKTSKGGKGGKYHGKGAQFSNFSDFNGATYTEADINTMIQEQLQARLQEELDYAEHLGVIAKSENTGSYSSILIPDAIYAATKQKLGEGVTQDTIVRSIIADNTLKTIIGAVEMTKVFTTDPAVYKSADDQIKRITGFTSTGENLRTKYPKGIWENDDLVVSDDYNVTTFTSHVFESPDYEKLVKIHTKRLYDEGIVDNLEDAEKVARDRLSALKKVDQTDAQTYITLDMYRALSIKLGDWSKTKEAAYKVLSNEDASLEDKLTSYKAVAQPLKMNYVKTYYRNGQSYTVFDKMSMATLYRPLVEGSQLEEILDRMEAVGKYEGLTPIHQVKFSTAQKSGTQDRKEIWKDESEKEFTDLNELEIYDQQFEYLRLQLVTEPHESARIALGSQMKKIGISNIKALAEYVNAFDSDEKLTGKDLVSEVHKMLSEISNRGVKKFAENMSLDDNYKVTDKKQLVESLRKEAKGAGLPSFVVDAFKYDEANGSYDIEFDAIPQVRDWIQSRLISMIKKAAVDVELPGNVFIQMTNLGLRTAEFSDDLQFFTEDGYIEAAVSVSMFKDVIPNYDNITFEQKVKFLEAHPELTMLGYRVPTQGQNSTYAMKVKKFLPENMGDVVILPAEGTAIGGFDFDIDKMYIVRHNYRNGKRIKYLTEENSTPEERYIEYMDSILDKSAKSEYFDEIKARADRSYSAYKGRLTIKHNDFKEASKEAVDNMFKFLNIIDIEGISKAVKGYSKEISGFGLSNHMKLKALQSFADARISEHSQYADYLRGDNVERSKIVKQENLADGYALLKSNIDSLVDELDSRAGEKADYIEHIKKSMGEKFWNDFRKNRALEMADRLGLDNLEEFTKRDIVEQNTDKAIQNRLIDMYMSVLQSDHNYIHRTLPLDYGAGRMKQLAEKVRQYYGIDDTPSGSFATLVPRYQISIKSRFKFGATGLGPFALASVHHILGQQVGLGLNDYIGVGNYTESVDSVKSTDLSQQLSTADMPGQREFITEWFSSLVSAHVDIAADPYIYYLNVNEYTRNHITLLLRAGVEGMEAFKFIAQPALYQIAKEFENKNNKLDVKVGDAKNDVLQYYMTAFRNLGGTQGMLKEEAEAVTDVFNTDLDVTMEFAGKYMDINQNINLDKLIEDKGEALEDKLGFLASQINTINAFTYLSYYADKLSEAILSSRIDTKKFGNNIPQIVAYQDKYLKALDDSIRGVGIEGYDRLFQETFLGALTDNSLDLSKNVVGSLLMEGTPAFIKLHQYVSDIVGQRFKINADSANRISNEIYSNIVSKYFAGIQGIGEKEIKSMFFGNDSIPNRIYDIKSNPKYSRLADNALLNLLVPRKEQDMPHFLSVRKPDDRYHKDSLQRSWKELLYDDDSTVSNLGEDLITYAYLTSGFRSGIHSFYEYIPLEALKSNGFNGYIKDLKGKLEQPNFLLDMTDEIFRNSWDNDILVPYVNGNLTGNQFENTVIKVPMKGNYVGENESGKVIGKPYVKVDAGGELKLYKYAGYIPKSRELVYYQVDKKSFYHKGFKVRENFMQGTSFEKANKVVTKNAPTLEYLNKDLNRPKNIVIAIEQYAGPKFEGFKLVRDEEMLVSIYAADENVTSDTISEKHATKENLSSVVSEQSLATISNTIGMVDISEDIDGGVYLLDDGRYISITRISKPEGELSYERFEELFLKDPNLLNNISINLGNTQRAAARKNLIEGKDTRQAEILKEFLQESYETGGFALVQGSGIGTSYTGVPIREGLGLEDTFRYDITQHGYITPTNAERMRRIDKC